MRDQLDCATATPVTVHSPKREGGPEGKPATRWGPGGYTCGAGADGLREWGLEATAGPGKGTKRWSREGNVAKTPPGHWDFKAPSHWSLKCLQSTAQMHVLSKAFPDLTSPKPLSPGPASTWPQGRLQQGLSGPAYPVLDSTVGKGRRGGGMERERADN